MAELKLDLTAGSGSYKDEEAEIMERLWTTQPYSKKQSLRKLDRVCTSKKKKTESVQYGQGMYSKKNCERWTWYVL